MSSLEILGVGTVGADADEVSRGSLSAAELAARWEETPFPATTAYAPVELDVKRQLGRKGTSFFDRRTALTILAARDALTDAAVDLEAVDRSRVGVVLGTAIGSIQSSVDYSVATFTQNPPHLVNPGLFPNTVMNGAAGQAAIWFGLTGVNATIGGGSMAFLSVLRYAKSLFDTDQSDLLVVGVVDELTPVGAWVAGGREDVRGCLAEGGALFVVRATDQETHDRPQVVGVTIGFAPSSAPRVEALARCATEALSDAGVAPEEVACVVGLSADELASFPSSAWLAGPGIENLDRALLDGGNELADPATDMIELARVLGAPTAETAFRRYGLLLASSDEGAVGCAVLRGPSWHS